MCTSRSDILVKLYCMILVHRKWDRPRYSVTLVSRDVWINSNEEKVDSLRVAKIDINKNSYTTTSENTEQDSYQRTDTLSQLIFLLHFSLSPILEWLQLGLSGRSGGADDWPQAKDQTDDRRRSAGQ